MIMISSPSYFAETPSVQVGRDSRLDSFFTTSRSTSPKSAPLGLEHLACTSCMATLTVDACCAVCGREFEP